MDATFQSMIDKALAASPSIVPPIASKVHTAPYGEHKCRARIEHHLPHRDVPEGTARLHIGVAGFYNFDIAARTRPDFMLLLDLNTHQQVFWKEIVALLKESETAETFRHNLIRASSRQGRLRSDVKENLYPRGSDEKLALRTHTEALDNYFHGSAWFHDAGAYSHLRHLALDDRIAAATIDLYDDKDRAHMLGEALKAQGLVADTCYWSNITEFTAPRSRNDYWFTPAKHGDDTPFATQTEDALHGESKLFYKHAAFYEQGLRGQYRWDGDEKTAFADLPPFERLLRNTAAIAGGGTHMYTNVMSGAPLIITDGAPRRTPTQWAAREALRPAEEKTR